jgi:hypothetical protein
MYARRRIGPGGVVAGLALVLGGGAACKGRRAAVPLTSALDATPVSVASATNEPREALDAGKTAARIAALATPTPICSAPEWPPRDPSKAADERAGVIRLGYLRKGQIVEVKPSILKKSNCPEGWYELLGGGFVCGKFATMDLNAKELADAPHPPSMDQPLPYDYGMNLTNGAPAYRRYPTRVERKQYEANLAVGKDAKADAPAVPPVPTDDDGNGTPWYLQSHTGRPQVSLDVLHDAEGPVGERMVRGFYVALDAPVHKFSGKFWRTTHGMLVPADFLLVHKASTEFEGVSLGDPDGGGSPLPGAAPLDETKRLPLAWMLGLHTRKVRFGDDGKPKRGDHVDRFTTATLTGNKKIVDDRAYYETTDGWWFRGDDATMTKPGPAPKDLASGEKWIDVNITAQTLVAYEGEKPVFATLVSSGRHDDKDSTKDHRTKTGSFRIREKHIAATMDADSSTDGPYSIQDVPWIMYFEGSYALHGAFWHLSFGHERSHGCVNLMPHDAKVLFAWTGPKLPEGWHGVHATAENPGTRVIVHE